MAYWIMDNVILIICNVVYDMWYIVLITIWYDMDMYNDSM